MLLREINTEATYEYKLSTLDNGYTVAQHFITCISGNVYFVSFSYLSQENNIIEMATETKMFTNINDSIKFVDNLSKRAPCFDLK